MSGYVLTIVPYFSISLILAMSCYVVLKSGEISFGQQAFFGVGAYAGGMLTALMGWPLAAALAAGTILGAIAALLAGAAMLRISGFQFSLMTLVIGEFGKEIFLKLRRTVEIDGRTIGPDGPLGFNGIDYFYIHHIAPTMQALLSLFAAAACVLLVAIYLKSRAGRTLIAVAADPDLCASLSINPHLVRLKAFMFAGAIAGLGGALFAHQATYIDATNFSLMLGVHAVAYTLLGGLGSVFGPVVGTFVDIVFLESLRLTGTYRMVIFGALIVLVLVARPQGLLGGAPLRSRA